MSKFLITFVAIIFSNFQSFSQPKERQVQGVVKLVYEKDTLGLERFWLTEKKFDDYFLIEDLDDYIGQLFLVCGAEMFHHKGKKIIPYKSLYDLKQFRSKKKREYWLDLHIGGDTFKDENGRLIVSFIATVEAMMFEKPPCDGFSFLSDYSCPVDRMPEHYPLIIITNVLKAKSLSKKFIKNLQYFRYKEKSFPIGTCD